MARTLGSNTAITFDISSLATSATFVAGRECTEVDISAFDDVLVYVDGIAGHAATAPTVGQQIRLYAWGHDASISGGLDVLDGTDSAETLGHVSVLNSLRLVGAPSVTVATANLSYYIQPFSVRQLFGELPKFFGLFLSHNHTGALAASQSDLFSYHGITYDNT